MKGKEGGYMDRNCGWLSFWGAIYIPSFHMEVGNKTPKLEALKASLLNLMEATVHFWKTGSTHQDVLLSLIFGKHEEVSKSDAWWINVLIYVDIILEEENKRATLTCCFHRAECWSDVIGTRHASSRHLLTLSGHLPDKLLMKSQTSRRWVRFCLPLEC